MNAVPTKASVRGKLDRGGALFASDEVRVLLDAAAAADRENRRLWGALEQIAACNGATANFTRYREVTEIARSALREAPYATGESVKERTER